MKKYVCKRNEVMAGKLIMVLPVISDSEENNFNGYESINCRSILYSVTDDNKGKDLIYSTPTFYELDSSKVQKNNDMKLYITDSLELGELLKYLNFNKDLTQKDLNKIFNMLLKHKGWLDRHPEVFNNDLFELYFGLKRLQSFRTKPYIGEPNYQLIKKI